jgi:YesN/AraC family two-component response regulator
MFSLENLAIESVLSDQYVSHKIAPEIMSSAQETIGHSERKLLLEVREHEEIYNSIEALIKEKKLYQEEDFSLDKLAMLTGYNRHYISETLNVFAKKSFYQYINEYRVDEVTRLLECKTNTGSNILSIAYAAGFKNKASFNQYFKKITGSTPSDYQKKIKAAH